jgi:hypothetical protein
LKRRRRRLIPREAQREQQINYAPVDLFSIHAPVLQIRGESESEREREREKTNKRGKRERYSYRAERDREHPRLKL